MRIFTKLLNFLTKLIELIIVVFMALDVISMLIQVVGREFGIAPPWTEELSRYLMIWIGLLGAAVIVRESGHLGVDIFVSLVKNPKIKLGIAAISHICTIVVGAIT